MKQIAEIAKVSGATILITEGGSHTRVQLGDRVTYVPRHAEINELTAKAILKQAKGEK